MKLTRRRGVVLPLLVSFSVLFGGTPQASSAELNIAKTTKAAEQGHAKAQFNLGLKYFTGQGFLQDNKQALVWFSKAAEQGDAEAQYYLGLMYDHGQGVLQDDKQAFAWYQKAAEQGHTDAQCNLGVMYAKGQGVPQDDVNAYAWSSIAAAQEDKDALTNRDIIAKRLTPEQRSRAQALAAELQTKIDKQKR